MDIYEILKLLITGIIGGAVGGWISFRFYIVQKRFDFKQQDDYAKREALREMLRLLPQIIKDIHHDWEMPEDSKNTSEEHITQLEEKVTYWQSLFTNDEEALGIIREINSIIGVTRHGFYGPGNIDVKKPAQIFSEIKETIITQIKQLDRSLTGRGK